MKELLEALDIKSEELKEQRIKSKQQKIAEIPLEVQKNLLKSFLECVEKSKTIKVGDFVERNSFGEQRYNFPCKGQAAMVSKVFEHEQLESDDYIADAEIAVLSFDPEGKSTVQPITVDLAYFRVVEDK